MDSKKIFKTYLKENKKTIVLLSILSSLFSLFGVIFAYACKLLLDNLNSNKFIVYATTLGILIILEVIIKLTTNVLYLKRSLKLENKIKKEALLSYLNNAYEVIDNKDTIDWLNRITSDSKVIADGVISYIPNLISIVVKLIASFLILLYINWPFALLLLTLGIITYFTMKLVRKKNKSLHKESQKIEGQNMGFYKNTITHFFLIKLFNSSIKIENQCLNEQDKYYKAKLKLNEFSIYISTSFTFLMRLSYLTAIIYAAILIKYDYAYLTYGSLLAMIQLIAQIEAPFTSLSALLPRYYHTLGSIERLVEFKAVEINKQHEITSFYEEIKINDISYFYKGNEYLFSHLSFNINPHDFILIKGHSGSGKTTLLKLIMGMYKVNEGRITYLNEDIKYYQNLFSYVPQGNYLINSSIKDNLTLFNKEDIKDEEIYKILKVVKLDEKIKSLKEGLNTKLNDDGAGLSIGEGQRLAIARGLLTNRPILILDEVTSSLDEETASIILTNLKNMNKTIIMVSHKLDTSSFANKIIDINKD